MMIKDFKFRRILFSILVAGVCVAVLPFAAQRVHAQTQLSGKTAMEITGMMSKGWNMGNTFDATGGNASDIYSQEQSWGNPQVTKELIDGVKAAGYDTIRIPITWNRFVDRNNGYQINEAFMNRINEVVDYAYDNELFVIINVHHEAWVNVADLDQSYEQVGEELEAVWKQIAERFANYDQHLIFEGMNEPRAQGTNYEWTGNNACYEAVNYLDQIFVSTVRDHATGYNAERMLMIPGYAASSSTNVLRSIKIPQIDGKDAENIAIAVHCYSPYRFCLSDDQDTFDSKKGSDTQEIDTLYKDLYSLFINKGYPVVIGECGATNSNDNLESRKAWFAYFGAKSNEYHIPAIVWDNGVKGKSGGECHYYLNRKTGEMVEPKLIDAFLTGEYIPQALEAEDKIITFEAIKSDSGTTLILPNEIGFTNGKLKTQMNVNHTEGVKPGFALKIDSQTQNEAIYKLSNFSGKNLHVTAWIMSKTDSTAAVCLQKNGEMCEPVAVSLSPEKWEKVDLYAAITEGETNLVFRGAEGSTIYVDDIEITILDEIPADATNTSSAPADGISGIENLEGTDKEEMADPVHEQNRQDGSTDQNGESENNRNGKVILSGSEKAIIIFVLLVVAAFNIGMIIRKKKNSK